MDRRYYYDYLGIDSVLIGVIMSLWVWLGV